MHTAQCCKKVYLKEFIIGAIEGSTGTLMQIDIGFSPLIRIWKCFHFEESSTATDLKRNARNVFSDQNNHLSSVP